MGVASTARSRARGEDDDDLPEDIRRIVVQRGGAIEGVYVASSGKIRLRCAEGHVFAPALRRLREGRWCPRCSTAARVARALAQTRARLDAVLRERGGTIVGDYRGTQHKATFRCSEGHEWVTQAAKLIYHGSWCPKCVHMRKTPREWIAHLDAIATAAGGELLSRDYLGDGVKLELRCEEGHRWWATPEKIKLGRWCPRCARARPTKRSRSRFEEALQERGGALLSAYVDTTTYVRLRCEHGHEWRTRPHAVLYHDKWCPACAKYSLQDMRDLAAAHGGACLSSSYDNLQTPLRWRCARGHTFTALPQVVRRGAWCRRCDGHGLHDFAEMRKLARRRGGECLTAGDGRVLSKTRLRWRCAEGHIWDAPVGALLNGHWCWTCAKAIGHSTRRLTLEDMHEAAARNGGECLSEDYVNLKTPLQWRCARGHVFEADPGGVRNGGNWCPRCSQRPPYSLEGVCALAEKRGGRCLSKSWDDRREPLQFECARGHRFTLTRGALKTGVWCSRCPKPPPGDQTRIRAARRFPAHSTDPLTLEDMQETAHRFGGRCLSKRYNNTASRLRWECARGHRWAAPPSEIRSRGSWCPVCAPRQPRSLKGVRALAKRRGGKCLTRAWTDRTVPLRLQCANGHRFEALLGALKGGLWCPDCPRPLDFDDADRARRKRRRSPLARLTIEDMQASARRFGGTCLSSVYVDHATKLRWRCARGHEWEAVAHNRRAHWCPICARNPPHSLDDVRELARARVGRCLTRSWDDRFEPLRFVCAEGHRFEQLHLALKGGLWCPHCA